VHRAVNMAAIAINAVSDIGSKTDDACSQLHIHVSFLVPSRQLCLKNCTIEKFLIQAMITLHYTKRKMRFSKPKLELIAVEYTFNKNKNNRLSM